MARLPRIVIPNQPVHIMHRGNNHQDIFITDDDKLRVKEDISGAIEKTGCRVHAYTIMTNHLHLLITPKSKEALSAFMQAMANRYVRYFNQAYNRTGSIWEGRYKSCLVDSEHYLFSLYRYIEMNPVRANMVKAVDDYDWSSYGHNGQGRQDPLITEHALYSALGANAEERARGYQTLFMQGNTEHEELAIDQATMRGEVYGSDAFHEKISKLISLPTKRARHGGDRKSSQYKNQAG
jgi:putative transposase